ncbi:MAG TPA: hypothetical protein DEP88_06695 [Verrucomicrobiales bacterium]|nr:hypothetical protein [Verrucomicrobiales bacterium]HCL96665.1 hypothetical protein [Verrucomicrobiales bacterium]
MKRFVIKCALFSLPLTVLFVPGLVHLEQHSELESIEEMARRSQKNGDLIGLAYTDPMHLVKQSVLKMRQPETVALGTSRVLPFRDFCFTNPESFYNCGRAVGKLKDFSAFVSAFPGKKPKVIILGLDQDFFNVEDEDLVKMPRSYSYNNTSYGTKLVKGSKAFFEACKDGKVETGDPTEGGQTFIGRNARLYHAGYRADGSYCCGRIMRQVGEAGDYGFETTIHRIDKGKGRFAPASQIHQDAISEVAKFLKQCRELDIHVVAFLPPYASKVYERFNEDASAYPYVFDLHRQLEPVFEAEGIVCMDYSDIGSLGANDFETTDGFHGSEVCYLKLLKNLAAKDTVLASFVNLEFLDHYIKNSYSARQIMMELPEADPREPNR